MAKIISFAKACELSKKFRKAGKKVIFTAGCFDILHIGHIEFFQLLRKHFGQNPLVFVGVETDKYITSRKGKNRPIFDQATRSKVLSSIVGIDFIVLLNITTDYIKSYKRLKPDFITFGNNELIDIITKQSMMASIKFKHLPHKIKNHQHPK